jgi:hypothetical protein
MRNVGEQYWRITFFQGSFFGFVKINLYLVKILKNRGIPKFLSIRRRIFRLFSNPAFEILQNVDIIK